MPLTAFLNLRNSDRTYILDTDHPLCSVSLSICTSKSTYMDTKILNIQNGQFSVMMAGTYPNIKWDLRVRSEENSHALE